ncbi:MAG: histidine kinase [Ferruginibacter sp.]
MIVFFFLSSLVHAQYQSQFKRRINRKRKRSNAILLIILLFISQSLTAQSIKTKQHADRTLSSIEKIQPSLKKLDTLRALFQYYMDAKDSLVYTVLGILKSNAIKDHDENYWGWYYYQRSFMERFPVGDSYLPTIDSAISKAKSIGNNELHVRALSEKTMYFWRNQRYNLALETGMEAVNLSEAHHFIQFLPYRYITLSGIYGNLGDTTRQYAMGVKACNAADTLNDLEAKAYCYGALANILAEKKEYGRAIQLLQSVMNWFATLDMQFSIACTHLSMAKAFVLMPKPDSAKLHARISLNYFLISGNKGLQKDAGAMLAGIYEKLNVIDSAIYYYNFCIEIGIGNKNILANESFHRSLADIYLNRQEYQKAAYHLQTYTLLHDSILNTEKNKSIEEISVKYETEKKDNDIVLLKKDKALKDQLLSKQQLLRNTLIIAIILLLLLGALVFNRVQLRKKIEQQQAITRERDRIITDLHDDIGATLSSMNIYGDLAANTWESHPQESKKMVNKISGTSKELMGRMGDIIWSMKPADEEKYTLESRLKNYSNELLSPKNIVCEFDIDEKLAASITNPEARKNILLIVKEAINNIAKYSEASKAIVSLKQESNNAILVISDNGKGYEAGLVKQGNGLLNMQQRSKQLNADCTTITRPGEGVIITCIFPIAIFSHKV